LCAGKQMTDHLKDIGVAGDFPDGWYFGSNGYSVFLPDEASGMQTFLDKVVQYGSPDVDFTGFASSSFPTLLTAVKLLNQLDLDSLTFDSVTSAIRSFTGPMMMVAGPMACGADPIFKSLCGTQMGVEQYLDGKWVAVADGLTGTPIDTAG